MHDPAERAAAVARTLVEAGCLPEYAAEAELGVTHLLAAGLDFAVTYGEDPKTPTVIITKNLNGAPLRAAAKQAKDAGEDDLVITIALDEQLADDQAWPGDRGDWNGLTQDLRLRINWARRRCLEHGHYITQVSGNRTYEQQVELRRQNCGPTQYDIYRKPPSQCRPVTAIPGTSNHEDGKASDLSPGPRSCPRCAAEFAAASLGFPVRSEDWHTEVISNPRLYPINHPNRRHRRTTCPYPTIT